MSVLLLLGLALVGHTTIWTTFVNRLHATTLPKRGIQVVNVIGLGALCSLPVIYSWLLFQSGAEWLWQSSEPLTLTWARWYALVCVPLGVVGIWNWARREFFVSPGRALRGSRATRLDMRIRVGDSLVPGPWTWLHKLPGNQTQLLEIAEKELEIPRLAPVLDGMTLAHVSDLHFALSLNQRHFAEVVELTNELDCDFILITGDIVDREACIDWIPATLGRLRARHGVYSILGNHDVRLKRDLHRLRSTLIESGIQLLGGAWTRVETGAGAVVLAGNELPWLRPAPDLRDCPSFSDEPETLQILLSHSPDQYPWAKANQFDLMLAGHNHGGQICLPVIGPLFSPSRFGCRYASGTFYEPPTVMHVSRGVAALDPLRYNCPPELIKLTLRCPKREKTTRHGARNAATAASGS